MSHLPRRVVGISGYTVRPAQARKEKPRVFAFTRGDIETCSKATQLLDNRT